MAEEPEERGGSPNKEPGLPRGNSGTANLGLFFLISLITSIAVVAAAAGINHAWPIFGTTSEKTNVVLAQPTPSVVPTPSTVEIDPGDNPAKGPADAKVTVVEFSDFQCPYCARFVQQTLPQILSTYGDKIRFVFMNFPLSQIHENAQKAAEASECANEQGAFWQYHDILFANQSALAVDNLKAYAAQLGLDATKFNECLDSGRMAPLVQADMDAATKAAQEAGLDRFGTPAFFINGKSLSGAQPFDVFKQAIDAALAEAG